MVPSKNSQWRAWRRRETLMFQPHSGAARGVVAAALLIACSENEAGRVAATKLGDLSHPAQRGSPIAALQQACSATGAITARGTDVIRRQPYLQQVTTSSAMVGWVSVHPESHPDGERVDVTTADGSPVMSAPGVVERTVVRSAGEQQMWARISGLEPDTIYCYALAEPGGMLSERIGFRTAPASDSARPIRFLAFGDSGGGNGDQRALFQHMKDVPFELMIHTGDLAYDNGTIGELEDTVFEIYGELFRHIPFYPAPGNHDHETEHAAPFRAVFALPGDGGEQWYSFDWGRIHFAALDTEADYATQAAWLDQDLARTALPWKIVYLHKPPYSSGDHGSDLALRAALAPVLERRGVQLVLAGHDHDYERTIPQHGVAYVVTGGGGRGTRPVSRSGFTAFSEDVIHYVHVEVTVDALVLHAIDATGQEFDSMVVARNPAR
jgi:hypothetical protein